MDAIGHIAWSRELETGMEPGFITGGGGAKAENQKKIYKNKN